MKAIKNIKRYICSAALFLGMSAVLTQTVFAGTYTVVSGDSLYKIGTLFGVSSQNIAADNKLSGNVIYPGQKLYVDCKAYTVQGGDSLYLIARKFGVSIDDLRKANNIWTDYINIGQVLNIPVAIPVPTPTPTPVVQVPQTGGIKFTAADVDLLARLITAEAQGESYNAKLAVGAVVVNRVKSELFPNTVYDVIYEKSYGYYQFTPVLNGWINKPADQDSIKAAYAALNGSDPTNGALYYYDNTNTNTWLLSKPVSLKVDNLTFAY